MANEIVQRGIVGRLLGNIVKQFGDGTQSPPGGPRFSPYGEQAILLPASPKQLAADEGTMFVTSMAPGATALQLGLSASFSAVAAALVCVNSGIPGQSPNVLLDRIHMVVSGAPTSAAAWNFATFIDSVNRTPTILSNAAGAGQGPGTAATATAYLAPSYNANMNSPPNGVGKWYLPLSTSAGAPPTVPPASGAARQLIGNGVLRSQIPVAGDEYTLQFGALDEPSGWAVTAAPAGYSHIKIGHPAVSIPPGAAFLLYMWGTGNITAGIAFSQIDAIHSER